MTRKTLAETEAKITNLSAHFDRLLRAIREVIIGHDRLLDALVMVVLCKGHILLERVSSLASTTLAAEKSA